MKIVRTDFALTLDGSPLGNRKLLQSGKRKVTNHSQIIRRMIFSDSGMIFIKGYVQTIMHMKLKDKRNLAGL